MKKLNYITTSNRIESRNYYKIYVFRGIEYYCPQDDGEYIVAIDRKNCLAVRTDFYEIDDMEAINDLPNDYTIVNHNGALKCYFDSVR